ncbi:MAG: hypothetical protein IJR85_10265 [Synergistaceae bacterium]|nr:hypothetical protein [Synergistaceae bacterium]
MNETISVECPNCHRERIGSTLKNSEFRCQGCGATLRVDSSGNVHLVRLKK